MILDILKAAVLMLVAAILQVTFVNSFELAEGHADIVLLAGSRRHRHRSC